MQLKISSPNLIERSNHIKRVSTTNGLIFIKQGAVFHKVKIEDILYLESDNVYINVHTPDKKFLVRSNLGSYMELLDAPCFFRVHRSFVINIFHIQTIAANHIFINNHAIPVGKTFRNDLLQNLRLG